LQNEPNFKITPIYTSTCITSSYSIFGIISHPKNEAKRTQNEPNFRPKLALFSLSKPNPVKIDNFRRLALPGNIFRFYSVFCVLRSVSSFVTNIWLCFSPKSAVKWPEKLRKNTVAKGILKIATCQFAVGSSVRRNGSQICHYIEKAAKAGADVVHFPESALSGYGGIDVPNFVGYDWDSLQSETEKIQQAAARNKIYVIFGSAHRIKGTCKPYQSLYLVNPNGQIQCRYDKRFCIKAELNRYTPGERFVYFTINGVKCSLLICFDVRFPEIYRQLYKQGVKCVLQSFYNAHQKGPSIHSDIMRQSMQCHAACNAMWASMSNSSGYYSPYPSCFIRPDGKIVKQLERNKAGIMVNAVDLSHKFYDPMDGFRRLAMKGMLSNKTI
jgi:predicted amidohydrolase